MTEKIKKYYEEHKEEIEKIVKKLKKIGGLSVLALAAFAMGRKSKSMEWSLFLELISTKDPNFKVLDLLDSEKVNQVLNAVTTE